MESFKGKTGAEIETIMDKRGFYLAREHFPWGKAMGFCSREFHGTWCYVDMGILYSDKEYKEYIKDCWVPAALADQIYKANHIDR